MAKPRRPERNGESRPGAAARAGASATDPQALPFAERVIRVYEGAADPCDQLLAALTTQRT
jgi:hypothetical protein